MSMFDTVMIFALLIGATIAVSYTAVRGRLESRVTFILIPTATILLSSLTIIIRAENPLLLGIVGTLMAGVAASLMVYAMFTMFKYVKGDSTSTSKSLNEVEREDSRSTKLEV